MKLGIDLDGVTADWSTAARRMLNNQWGYQFDLNEDVPTWDFIKESTSKKHWQWLWSAGVEKYGLFARPYPVPGAQYILRKLTEEHDVYFLTDRPKKARADTFRWISDILNVNAAGLIIDKTKTAIPCDIFLDDKPSNVEMIKAAFPEAKVYLFDRRYNRSFEWPLRITSWEHFFTEVKNGD